MAVIMRFMIEYWKLNNEIGRRIGILDLNSLHISKIETYDENGATYGKFSGEFQSEEGRIIVEFPKVRLSVSSIECEYSGGRQGAHITFQCLEKNGIIFTATKEIDDRKACLDILPEDLDYLYGEQRS